MEQRLEPGLWPRHRHRSAYAAIVLSGGYLEAGGAGRWRVEPGDVIAHPAFDAHQNHLPTNAWVLNLPLPPDLDLPPVFRVADFAALERAWRTDAREAVALLAPVTSISALVEDWPDLLAADLSADPSLSLGVWAHEHGLARATVSRGFRSAFGITPAAFRAERRAHAAWCRLQAGADPLCAIAHDAGFADQAHFSRAIRALTGASPRDWRRVKTVQDRELHPA